MGNKNFFAVGTIVLLLGTLLIYSTQKGNTKKSSSSSTTDLSLITAILTPTPTKFDTATPSATIDNMDEQNGLKIEDLVVGTGAEATAGKTVSVNYKGTFVNGSEFDSSYKRGVPFEFTLGAGRVIKGWDLGFTGMKVGGKRKLTVPPELGYGPNDYGPIPGNSTLIFEVELLEVR